MNTAIEAIAAPTGFTLVEDEDVAFTLRLCREVNRIYGQYHGDGLASTDPLLTTLAMTAETLAALGQVVKDGMPGVRITVAAAQTREMLVVMFDQDPMKHPSWRKFEQHYPSVLGGSAPTGMKSIDQPRGQVAKPRRGAGLRALLGRRHRRGPLP
jgi:hypothetical protein